MDPRDAIDANDDADQDGNWDCSGVGCVYEPYTNFQEYFAITSEELSSPNAVRLSGLTYQGEVIQEGWQLRALLLGLGQWDEGVRNYLKMDKSQSSDFRYAYIVNDNDVDFLFRMHRTTSSFAVVISPILGRFTTQALRIPLQCVPLASTNTDGISWITTMTTSLKVLIPPIGIRTAIGWLTGSK